MSAATNQLSSDQAANQAFFNSLSSALAKDKSTIKTAGYISTDFSSMPTVPASVLPSGDYIKDCKDCVCRNNILDCITCFITNYPKLPHILQEKFLLR